MTHMSADGKRELPTISTEDWKIKMAAERMLAEKGYIKADAAEELASKIVIGVLLFAFVVGISLLFRSSHPWNCYCRRYWYW